MFAKEFNATCDPSRARLYLLGLGVQYATLSEKVVSEEALTPSYSTMNKTLFYTTYDVTDLISSGANVLGVDLGKGEYDAEQGLDSRYTKLVAAGAPDPLELIAQLEYSCGSGVRQTVVSDSTWRTTVDGPWLEASWYGGWFNFSLVGSRGNRIVFWPGDRLLANGSVDQSTTGSPIFDALSSREMVPNLSLTALPVPWLSILEVYGLQSDPATADFVGLRIRFDAAATGILQTNIPLFNDIPRIINQAIQAQMYTVLTDCPHREKLGWLDQDHLSIDPLLLDYDLRGTAGFAQGLAGIVQIAEILGERADAARFQALHEEVLAAYPRAFFNTTLGVTYGSGSQCCDLMSLNIGVVPQNYIAAVHDHLLSTICNNGSHLSVGEVCLPLLFDVLSSAGYNDVLYAIMSQTINPSYGYQVVNGATTLTEH